MKQEESLFLKCDCCTHAIEIERYDHSEKDHVDTGFWIALWEMGPDGAILSWKERFRWIWNVIKTGHPWSDHVILTDANARKLKGYIDKHLAKE